MNITRWNMMGLALLALVLNCGLAQAFTLPGNSVPGIQKDNAPKAIQPKAPLPEKANHKRAKSAASTQAPRSLPSGVKGGVNHRVGTINQTGNKPARPAGFSSPALPGAMKSRLHKPVTGPGGKPLLPPKTGTRHLLHDGHTTPGGFAGVPGAGRPHLNKPVTGPAGKPLLSPGVTSGPRHLLHDGPPIPRGGFPGVHGTGNPIVQLPLTGTGGTSLSPPQVQLKLRFDRVEDGSGRVIREVTPNTTVRLFFTIENLGTDAGTAYVNGDAGIGRSGPVTVAPGQRQTVAIPVEVRTSGMTDSNAMWSPVFMLYDANPSSRGYGRIYVDSFARDNVATVRDIAVDWPLADLGIPLPSRTYDNKGGFHDMKVTMGPWNVGFHRIPWLHEAWKGGGYTLSNTLTLKVRVIKRGPGTSAPRHLTVSIKGLNERFEPFIRTATFHGNRAFPLIYSKTFNCSGAGCPMSVTVTVPALSDGEVRDIPITFNNLGYKLWVDIQGHHHGVHNVVPGGYYQCANFGGGSKARIKITAVLDSTGERDLSDNGYRQIVGVGKWLGAGCNLEYEQRPVHFAP